ncbi:MAG: phosphate ABC transporter ATP-binding protein [Actinobacteria bacterium]|nr:phosphate ABC transporter ATP-binding protein [Actinomycetota bacterium]
MNVVEFKKPDSENKVVEFVGFGVSISGKQIFEGVSFPVYKNCITAIMGPSGSGKTTLLRSINRLLDEFCDVKYSGKLLFEGRDVINDGVDKTILRARIGMVFQRPNPFPGSIFDNVVYGLRLHGVRDKKLLEEVCIESLKKVGLYREVKNRLHRPAYDLSGGQQQRLCIARSLAVNPHVVLLDEPTSSLDPTSSAVIEELLTHLKKECTIIIVTHNLQQAGRISDYVAFLYPNEDLVSHLIEFGQTREVFFNPKESLTESYIAGKSG